MSTVAGMSVAEWLLDSDPSIRWQVMRDLSGQPADVIAAERARVASEGWGARLLELQGSDGQWAGGAYFPALDAPPPAGTQPWTATTYTLLLLREMGLDPASPQARKAVSAVRENSKWEYHGGPFFEGEVEPCVNGMTVALGSYFGEDVRGLVDRLLGEQLEDGGWNCEAENGSVRSSFHTTICVLEGLLEFGRAHDDPPEVAASRHRAEEYLLERGLLRRLSTGELADPDWTLFSFPTRWYYDALRGLDYLRGAGLEPDERCAEAIQLVESKRGPDGKWLLENTHPGDVHFDLEDGDGNPSRWNTLRALRVLKWYSVKP